MHFDYSQCKQKGSTQLLIILAALLILIGGGIYLYQLFKPPTSPNSPNLPNPSSDASPAPSAAVYCPADVMECPDHSFVGRIPPNCEFVTCPTSDEFTN